MRQVTDPRAPFPDIDTALTVAEQFVRSQGGSFVGAVAEEQHGGYFVRVVYQEPLRSGSRHSRNRRVNHTVEIGRIEASDAPGTEEGQLCRRDGCDGTLKLKADHMPPYCPECGWNEHCFDCGCPVFDGTPGSCLCGASYEGVPL